MTHENDFRVNPLPWAEIEAISNSVRETFKLSGTPFFPILDFLEKILPQVVDRDLNFSFQIGEYMEMGTAEGLTCPNGTFIRIREDVYNSACSNIGRSRFTLAHEFGHFMLHTGANQPLARALPGEKLRAFESAEKQADHFAATLLMPEHLILDTDESEIVAKRFGVSTIAAQIRIEKLNKKRGKK